MVRDVAPVASLSAFAASGRQAFPLHYFLLGGGSIALGFIDLVLAAAVGTRALAITAADVGGLFSQMTSLAIWGTYLLRSVRVRETFVR
jgi:hypothetical protein